MAFNAFGLADPDTNREGWVALSFSASFLILSLPTLQASSWIDLSYHDRPSPDPPAVQGGSSEPPEADGILPRSCLEARVVDASVLPALQYDGFCCFKLGQALGPGGTGIPFR